MSYFNALNYTFNIDDLPETVFVFDTNFFLYAYQSYREGKQYLKAIDKVIEQAYIPYIVYIEFLTNVRNTISKVKKDIKTLDIYMQKINPNISFFPEQDIKNHIKKNTFQMKDNEINNISKLLKEDTDSLIDSYINDSYSSIESLISTISDEINNNLNNFKNQNKRTPDISSYEKSVETLDSHLEVIFSKILGEPYTKDNIKDYLSDLDDRYSNEIPPGYCDSSKDGYKLFGGLKIPSNSGDLLLWKDTLSYIKKSNNNFKYIVIVSDDGLSNSKNDWREHINKDEILVHHNLKFEMFEKTNHFLDIISVKTFLSYFIDDAKHKKVIENELDHFLKSESSKITFTIKDKIYEVNNLNNVMISIANYIAKHTLISFSQLNRINSMVSSTMKSDSLIEVLSNTKHILSLAKIPVTDLYFKDDSIDIMWRKVSLQPPLNLIKVDQIFVFLKDEAHDDEHLEGSIIVDVTFVKNDREFINKETILLTQKLINKKIFSLNDDYERVFNEFIRSLNYRLTYNLIYFL